MTEKNENDPLSKWEHLKLEAYRSLDHGEALRCEVPATH